MLNPEELAYKEPSKRKFRLPAVHLPSKRVFIIVNIFILGIALGAAGIYGYQYYKNMQPAEIPGANAANNTPPQQVFSLIEKVEKHGMSLPNNEFPSVATIKDLASLSDQAFFDGAAVGDKVMIYSTARVAILYRPSSDKVIRKAPVQIMGDKEEANPSSTSAVLSASDSAEPALKIKY